MLIMICLKLVKYFFRFAVLITIVLVVLAFAPEIPPYEEFIPFEVKPVANYDGKMTDILNKAKVCIDDGKISRPESIAVKGSSLFVGESGFGTGEDVGRILKINEQDWSITTVADLAFPCDKLGRSTCSGVLGIRFDPNGKLLVADMYGGLLKIDVDTGKVEVLVSPDDVIGGAKLGFLEDVAVARDGTIYFTDGGSSWSHKKHYNTVFSIPTGRLLKYDPISKKSSVLMEGIYFANGVELAEDETFVLVSEMMKYRIIRYHLKGPKKGQSDVFQDGLPGFPDNIRRNGKGGYFVAIATGRTMIEINSNPVVVKLFARITYIIRSVFAQLYNYYPHETIRLAYDMVAHIGMIPMFLADDSNLGLILELNHNGNVIRGLNSTIGNVGFLSQATLSNKYLLMVSPMHDKIWCLEKEKL